MFRNLDIKTLYQGCYLASISCAVMAAKFPELSFEHSWDGINYSVQDGFGNRGTITFQNKLCVGAFRSDESDRLSSNYLYREFLINCPNEILELAEAETLQYLLENKNGKTIPVITSCFWSSGNHFNSVDSWEKIFSNGGSIIIPQLSSFEIGLEHWKNYYEMSSSEVNLVLKLLDAKLSSPYTNIWLESDRDILSKHGLTGFQEAKQLLESMNIYIKI